MSDETDKQAATVEIEAKYSIERAMPTEHHRAELHGVRFGDGRAFAADGRMLASVPAKTMGRGVIPGSLIELPGATTASLSAADRATTWSVRADGTATTVLKSGATVHEATDPDRCQVDMGKVLSAATSQPVRFAVTLNPTLLSRLAAALGLADAVRLEFHSAAGPVVVRPGNPSWSPTDDPVGLLALVNDAEPLADLDLLSPVEAGVAVDSAEGRAAWRTARMAELEARESRLVNELARARADHASALAALNSLQWRVNKARGAAQEMLAATDGASLVDTPTNGEG